MSEINLRRLEIFRAVYSTGSVSEAARQLSLAQPSVSRHLKYFESQVGVTLFNLVKGRLHSTSDAHRLFDATSAVFDQVHHIDSVIDDLRRGRGVQLRINSLLSISTTILPQVMASVSKRWPEASIEMQSGSTHQQLAALRMRTSDVGISAAVPRIPGIHREVIGRERALVAVHESHPLAEKLVIDLEDFAAWPCIDVAGSGSVGSLFHARLESAGITPNSRFTARYGGHIPHLVQHLTSFGLIGSLLTHETMPAGVLFRPLKEDISYDIHMMWNVGRTPSDIVNYLKSRTEAEFARLSDT